MQTQHFHSPRGCLSYITWNEDTREAALIDPSLEVGLETYLQFMRENALVLKYCIETHTHADHISIAHEVRDTARVPIVRHTAAPSPAKDIALVGGETLPLGTETLRVLATPGHTNESISLYNGREVFTGDTLLIGGTGRTDFQVGDSESLYHSIHHVLGSLPPETKLRPGHDYKGRNEAPLGDEMHTNPRVLMCESEFIHFMDGYHPPKPELFDVAIPKNSE